MHQLQQHAQHSHQHQHQHESSHLADEHHQPHYHHAHDPAQTPRHAHHGDTASRKHHGGHGQHGHSHSHGPSPYHSRHASPHHSHSQSHSHSLHSSPHQSHGHVHDCGDSTIATNTNTNTITNSAPSSSSAHHHHHHRRRRRSHHPPSGGGGGVAGGTTTRGHHQQQQHNRGGNCSRRHRSTTDVSSTSINTCHEPLCADREVQEILVRKSCCGSTSRTELAQYFAEDLYGSSSRRPSSCCTSSDYCYHTDSTSLYGSRSSLSRNNSIKSASGAVRRRRGLHQRQPSYTSISLRGLNASRPNSQLGSLTSIFDRAKQMAEQQHLAEGVGAASAEGGKVVVSPSKVTIERQSSSSSRDALNKELPEYACSPSPIRWSFLADGKSPTEFEGAVGGDRGDRDGDGETTQDDDDDDDDEEEEANRGSNRESNHGPNQGQKRGRDRYRRSIDAPQTATSTQAYTKRKFSYEHERPTTSASVSIGPSASASASTSSRKCRGRESPFSCDFEESTTVLFHQEAEAFNNCCSNYIQCNSYLDQDLQITSEDIHQYLSKGSHQAGDVLNNSKNYPFQPSNALEFQYKNNFANNNSATPTDHGGCGGGGGAGGVTGDSVCGYDAPGRFRRNSSKETNLNQNSGAVASGGGDSCAGAVGGCPMSPTNINLSSSTNNINIVFSSYAGGEGGNAAANEVKFINTTRENLVSAEGHHAGYLPYTYPSYDYTNMSANSLFDKPLGIDAIPPDDGGGHGASSETDGQYSSSLQSPVQATDVGAGAGSGCGIGIGVGVDSFDSFDAASSNNLLSQRSSCQFSPRSPLSPRSPGSPATTSSISATIDPSYQHRSYYQQPGGAASSPSPYDPHRHHQHQHQHQHQHHNHHHQHHHHQQHSHLSSEGSKLSSAFKRVRKRARNFLRKK